MPSYFSNNHLFLKEKLGKSTYFLFFFFEIILPSWRIDIRLGKKAGCHRLAQIFYLRDMLIEIIWWGNVRYGVPGIGGIGEEFRPNFFEGCCQTNKKGEGECERMGMPCVKREDLSAVSSHQQGTIIKDMPFAFAASILCLSLSW